MSTVTVYTLQGKESGKLELNDAVFGVQVKPDVVQFVARAQRANAHVPYAHTKGRAEVRGGGKKPWRQKGTGRARHGSSRSPIWVGGGITFGPTKFRNMSQKVNKKQKRTALKMMLTDKAQEQRIIVVDSWNDVDGKTKQIAELMKAVSLDGKSALIAAGEKTELLTRAAKNLPKVNTTMANSVSVGDLLKYQYLVIDSAGVEQLTSLLTA